MQKIMTFLTFNDQSEEAANLYTSIFKDSAIGRISRQSEAKPVLSVTFHLSIRNLTNLLYPETHRFQPS